MKSQKVKVMGLGGELDEWSHESCIAHIATGDDWATIYDIQSTEPSKGHATVLLTEAKRHYEGLGLKFGGSIALNSRMRRIYQRLAIHEYTEEEGTAAE
jgi:hypothetical protein